MTSWRTATWPIITWPTRPAPTCAAGWGEPPRPVSRTNGLLTWPLRNRNAVSSINAYGNWTKKIPFPMSNSAHTERLSSKCGVCKREQDAIIEECFAYDEELFRTGRVDAGAVLQGTPTAKTLRWKSGKVMVTDGPFAETREQLGGISVLEARDMDHAVALMSKHPGVRHGFPFEIRPIDEEFTALGSPAGSVQARRSERWRACPGE